MSVCELVAKRSDFLTGNARIRFLTLPLASGGIAHDQLNWLSPTKTRQMVTGGSKQTLVWDDRNAQQQIRSLRPIVPA